MNKAPILLKSDKMNGQEILRPVQDGVVQSGVVFPPSVVIARPAPVPVEELVEQSMRELITVSDQSAPEVHAQALLYKKKLHGHQMKWLIRAALNERSHMIEHLERLGMSDAAKALRNA
jgi:hypothetical protein